MCRAVEELIKREKLEAGRKNALSLLYLGKLTVEEIAKCLELSIDEVKKLAEVHGL